MQVFGLPRSPSQTRNSKHVTISVTPETAVDLDPESTLGPAPEPIQRKLLKPHTLVSFAIAIAIVAFLINRLNINLGAVWSNIRDANPILFGSAFILYYVTFIARTLRWRYMLNQAGINSEAGY